MKNAVKAYNETIQDWRRTRQKSLTSGWAQEPIKKLRPKYAKPFKPGIDR